MYQYKWDYNVVEVGFKYHLNDILSLIGLVQLRDIDEANQRRAQIAGMYAERLGRLPGVILPAYSSMAFSSFHFLPLFFERKAEVYQTLTASEIYPGMHYKSNVRYPMFRDCARVGKSGDRLEGADWYEARELTLPIHLGLTDADIAFICDTAAQACV